MWLTRHSDVHVVNNFSLSFFFFLSTDSRSKWSCDLCQERGAHAVLLISVRKPDLLLFEVSCSTAIAMNCDWFCVDPPYSARGFYNFFFWQILLLTRFPENLYHTQNKINKNESEKNRDYKNDYFLTYNVGNSNAY